MRKDVRLNRLKKLKYMLDNHDKIFPEVEFDMWRWSYGEGSTAIKSPSCGTAACALGSAAFYPPFNRAGLIMHQVINHPWGRYSIPKYGNETGYEAGMLLFGISLTESLWLFNPAEYITSRGKYHIQKTISRYVTTEVVARRVSALIKAYSSNNVLDTSTLTDNHRYGLGK